MKILIKWVTVCLWSVVLLWGCKLTAQQKTEAELPVTTENQMPEKKKAPPLPIKQSNQQAAAPAISPGHCRIIGKVIAISPEPEAGVTGICGQVPCRAKVKIQKILGYGHSFNQTLAVDQEINAYFTFSLQPSAKLLPNMTTPLPGLKIGSSFQADISPGAEMVGTTSPWYQVAVYQIP
ncbi:hypothetical protein [Adhaeribacter radiodurans]|uniref:Uncharacterized protein n=1 Tax=Adhaeribacter radiodurans TaxID=2745197 RepID=A0A7L7L2L8_9BACT|nr:hypothetical protein [Adhaeribacter radiodurans]QMU27034.1 hypothetical protein HUW48_02855 [Adhaeribacter radiodurans]